MARGSLSANGVVLNAGDALSGDEVASLRLSGGTDAEVLVFDLPPR
jgi:hypothetical protein